MAKSIPQWSSQRRLRVVVWKSIQQDISSRQGFTLCNFNYLLHLLLSLVLCFCGIYLSRLDIDLVDRIASRLLNFFRNEGKLERTRENLNEHVVGPGEVYGFSSR